MRIQPADFHVHTTFCDGKCSAEEVVLTAIDKGLSVIGISGHAPMPFPVSWCIPMENLDQYLTEISSLKKKYAGRIRIYCGVELDYYSEIPTSDFDYVIGSVHYVKKDGEFIPIDHSRAQLCDGVTRLYQGDFYALIQDYFALIGEIAEKKNADIVGHFDVVSKFNEANDLFDPSSPLYREAWQAAVDRLLRSKALFEINSGAITRGYRSKPYPSEEIMQYIARRGGMAILTSDSHHADSISAHFELSYELAKRSELSLARSFRQIQW